MDAGLAAFLGAIAGAAIAGVPPVVAAVVQRGTAKDQRQHDKDERDAQREHDRRVNERAERLEQLREWREGLSKSHAEYRKWDSETRGRSSVPSHLGVKPTLDSGVWFQSLRPHLPKFGSMAGSDDPAYYSIGTNLECDDDAADVLAREINRIEREWLGD
jgi:hypothetical protein